MGQLISYICGNYRRNVSLDMAAHELGVSRYCISRIFTNKIGVSFSDYINSLRIDFAKKRLKSSDIPISEISIESGFENQRSFNRTFKKFCGKSPKEYRLDNL